MPTITPNLWFDTEAEEAARFYVSVFKNSKLGRIATYPAVGQEHHGRAAGSVMTVEFELDGKSFLALNAGPHFKFNEAISLVIPCETQDEIDYYWSKLSAHPENEQCGWVKDKYGVSWQIAPTLVYDLWVEGEEAKRERAFAAMMQMKKLDIAALKKAYEG